jgi:hypothetical protein
VWKMASICLFWCLWRKMNNRSFEDLESTFYPRFTISRCTFGLRLMCTLLLFSFDDFLVRISRSIWVFPLYTLRVLRGALRF